ncbi:MAG: DUF342 domain-containing protein [Gammaproteobacteria bacterium]|nr:DUF342 domain-containing protein [Gammaproteobacteria bacterium]
MLELSADKRTLEFVITDRDLPSPPDLARLRDLFRQSAVSHYLFRDDLAEQLVLVMASARDPSSPSPLGQRYVIAEARDATVDVTVSDDRMEARMRVAGPRGGGPVTLDLIRVELRRAGVIAGLDSSAIATLLRDGAQLPAGASREGVVARGRPPQRGQDARLERLTPTAAERMLKPQQREDGTVDMRDLGSMVTVGKGEPLMRKHPATNGVAGFDVTGAPIPAEAGSDLSLIPGEGTELSPQDPLVLLAAREGAPVQVGDSMKVDDVVVFKKVDVTTGHVRFKGSVIIEGDVREGMVVESDGDVTIAGCIDSATVIARGTVAVKQGIIGHLRDNNDTSERPALSASVQAGREISCAFAQYAELRADLAVKIERLCTHCQIEVGEELFVGNPEKPAGRLFGGFVVAGQRVVAGEVGTAAGARTIIDFSSRVTRLRDLMGRQVQEMKEKKAMYDLLRRKIEAMHQQNQGNLDTDTMIAYEEFQELGLLLRQQKDLLKSSRDQHDATIGQLRLECHRSLHAGAAVRFLGKTMMVDHDHGPTVVHLVEGEMTIEPLKR